MEPNDRQWDHMLQEISRIDNGFIFLCQTGCKANREEIPLAPVGWCKGNTFLKVGVRDDL